MNTVSQSACPITNQTCLCTDELLQDDITTCVLASCTVKEALCRSTPDLKVSRPSSSWLTCLAVAKNISATSCNVPIRNKQDIYTTTSTTLGVLSGVFVILRFATKIFIIKVPIALDDWFILITTVVGVPSSVINVHGTTANGLGRDIWTLPYDMVTNFGLFFYVSEVIYFTDLALLKLSLLFFYLRIFPTAGVRRLLWGTVAFTCTFGTVFVVLAIFQCRPISYYWSKWDNEHSGQCLDNNAVAWANAGISIALDLWMIAIPLHQLRGLSLHWKKKIGVGLMFCVGTL